MAREVLSKRSQPGDGPDYVLIKYSLIFKCYFLRRAHGTKQTPFMMVFPSGTHLSAELTEAMQIKCLAQGHNALMQPRIELSIAVSRNRPSIT